MELASTSKCVTLDTTYGHFPDRTPAWRDGTDSKTRDFWHRKNKISGKATSPVLSNLTTAGYPSTFSGPADTAKSSQSRASETTLLTKSHDPFLLTAG